MIAALIKERYRCLFEYRRVVRVRKLVHGLVDNNNYDSRSCKGLENANQTGSYVKKR